MRSGWLMPLIGAAIFSLSGCGSPSVDSPDVSSSEVTSTSPALAEARLDTTRFEFAPKWVPVQFAAEFAEGQSVSVVDEWPRDDDVVQVLCTTEGGEYLSLVSGSLETTWYRLFVPEDKADPASKSRAAKTQGGYLGYLEAFWLTPAPEVTACTS
jgi:hypothetical protein